MTYAITGASGTLGRLVADQLLTEVDPAEVVLITRSPDKLADFAARGASVRQGDFDDQAGLKAALAGVDKLLLISTDVIDSRLAQQIRAVHAAAAAGVGHVVYTSAPHPTDDNPALVIESHQGTETALRASGLQWTFLRNNLYSEYQIPAAQAALAGGGQLYTNAADGRTAYVSRNDCARAAVGALIGTGHENVVYDITGPEALTQAEFATIVGELTDCEVTAVQLDDQTLHAGMTQSGLPDAVAGVLVSFGVATREGFLSTVSTHVKDLTGQNPTPLFDTLSAAKDQLVTVAG